MGYLEYRDNVSFNSKKCRHVEAIEQARDKYHVTFLYNDSVNQVAMASRTTSYKSKIEKL